MSQKRWQANIKQILGCKFKYISNYNRYKWTKCTSKTDLGEIKLEAQESSPTTIFVNIYQGCLALSRNWRPVWFTDFLRDLNKTQTRLFKISDFKISHFKISDFLKILRWLSLSLAVIWNHLQILTGKYRKSVKGLLYEILEESHKFQWHVGIHIHWGQYQEVRGCNNQI